MIKSFRSIRHNGEFLRDFNSLLRDLRSLSSAVALTLMFTFTDAHAKAPNVVFILADNLAWSDTTLLYTAKFHDTPNIERLPKPGVLFTKALFVGSGHDEYGDPGPPRREQPEHDFETGIMRGRVNPYDGQLYVCGLNGWNDNGRAGLTDGGIYRVRYTGTPPRMIDHCEVAFNELRIGFNFALDRESAKELASYTALQWNYKWTGGYGSDVYHPETGEVGKQVLSIDSASLSLDGKLLTLRISNLRPVNQLHLSLDVVDASGQPFVEDIFWTIHGIPKP